jgi:hypothetical protein
MKSCPKPDDSAPNQYQHACDDAPATPEKIQGQEIHVKLGFLEVPASQSPHRAEKSAVVAVEALDSNSPSHYYSAIIDEIKTKGFHRSSEANFLGTDQFSAELDTIPLSISPDALSDSSWADGYESSSGVAAALDDPFGCETRDTQLVSFSRYRFPRLTCS